MKYTLILIALLAATVSVKAQSKKDSSMYIANRLSIGFANLRPISWIVIGAGLEKPMLTIDNPKNGWNYPIDSIVIHAKKQKVRWLNDSTAVITK